MMSHTSPYYVIVFPAPRENRSATFGPFSVFSDAEESALLQNSMNSENGYVLIRGTVDVPFLGNMLISIRHYSLNEV